MSYSVDFTIDDGYCGPLNYLFYGDDDMWVYLDGKLVADIGGVHSSVGIYVDFWDYIEKGTEGELYQSAYWYYIVDENGEQTESGLVPAGTGELRLRLKDGYKAVIPSLPEGSGYVIGEVTDEDYDTSADSDDPAAVTGEKDGLYTIEGTIDAVSDPAPPASGAEQSDKDAHWVHFTNSYEPVQPEPEEPDKPGVDKPDKPDTDIPKTDDAMNISPWMVLMIISAAGAAVLIAMEYKTHA